VIDPHDPAVAAQHHRHDVYSPGDVRIAEPLDVRF
jgi:hypothetical protein